MVVAAIAIGIGVPYVHYGGIGAMFAALAHARPVHLTMPGATANLGHTWYVSTVLLTSLGFYMWPHAFAAAFTARSGDTLRRNAVVMPLYTITLAFVFFAGFTAVLVVPGLRNGDLALLTVVRQSFPPWFLGVIGGAGALTAMVPAAILILTAATLFAKNLYRPIFAPAMTDDQVAVLARAMVVVVSPVSLYFAIYSSTTLVSLLLLGYAGVSQFFPGCGPGSLLEACHDDGGVRGHDCRRHACRLPDALQPRSLLRLERWVRGALCELFDHHARESAHANGFTLGLRQDVRCFVNRWNVGLVPQ